MSINLCFMSPIKYLSKYTELGDMLFALPHIIDESNEYTDYFYKNPKYKILDSGVIELGKPYAAEELFRVAKSIDANEVALPDYLFDAEQTIQCATSFGKEIDNLQDLEFNLMGIVQGDSVDNWLRCFEVLSNLSYVNVLGISIYSSNVFKSYTNRDDCLHNRIKCVEVLLSKNMIPKKKSIHLLGMEDPAELRYQKEHEFIRSCDTTRPIIYGVNKVVYTSDGYIPTDYYKGPKMDYYTTIDSECHAFILENINIVKECASK